MTETREVMVTIFDIIGAFVWTTPVRFVPVNPAPNAAPNTWDHTPWTYDVWMIATGAEPRLVLTVKRKGST